MTPLRYAELAAGGPKITAEDRQRLASFVPKLRPIPLEVHVAWYGLGWRRPAVYAGASGVTSSGKG